MGLPCPCEIWENTQLTCQSTDGARAAAASSTRISAIETQLGSAVWRHSASEASPTSAIQASEKEICTATAVCDYQFLVHIRMRTAVLNLNNERKSWLRPCC